MGIHSSSELSTERRVVDHPFKSNMKAFMTACAVLASSANADYQVVDFHTGQISPYNVMPFSQGGYANSVSYSMNQPLTGVTPRPPTTYGMGPFATYGVNPVTYGMVPTFSPYLVKREIRESPYIIQTRMDNPVDGSAQEVQIKVDEFGNGKSFQHVEQMDERNVMGDNYMLEQRAMAQRPLVSNRYISAQRAMDSNNQMRMDHIQRNHMGSNKIYRNPMERGYVGLEDQQAMSLYQPDSYQNIIINPHDPQTITINPTENPTDATEPDVWVDIPGDSKDVIDALDSLNGFDHEGTLSELRTIVKNAQELWRNSLANFKAKAVNLKEAAKNHDQMKANVKAAWESHAKLGAYLDKAMDKIESTPAADFYRNMKNNRQMVGYNMRNTQMVYPQNQMIHF